MNIIITGASKGIGKSTAEVFAANGHNVYLCARNEMVLNNTVKELQSQYPSVIVKGQPTDITNEAERKNFVTWILQNCNQIDVLVNNAGQFIPGSVHSEPEGILEKMIEINLYSAYHITRLLLPMMIQQKSGHIFNMCSTASLHAYSNGGSYSISKFALLGFSKNLREEMKPYGIKVTSIMSGAAFTSSWEGSNIDPKRMMEARDVAQTIYAASQLSQQAVIEDILMRPQLGDL